jgi:hypothetical protein
MADEPSLEQKEDFNHQFYCRFWRALYDAILGVDSAFANSHFDEDAVGLALKFTSEEMALEWSAMDTPASTHTHWALCHPGTDPRFGDLEDGLGRDWMMCYVIVSMLTAGTSIAFPEESVHPNHGIESVYGGIGGASYQEGSIALRGGGQRGGKHILTLSGAACVYGKLKDCLVDVQSCAGFLCTSPLYRLPYGPLRNKAIFKSFAACSSSMQLWTCQMSLIDPLLRQVPARCSSSKQAAAPHGRPR